MYWGGGKGGNQGWGGWSPQLPKGTKAKKNGQEKPKGGARDGRDGAGVTKPYDATSLPASSTTAPQDSDSNLFIRNFMEYLKEAKVELPEKLMKHMPEPMNSAKEDIRSQQKRLNRHRTVVNKLESKRKALEKDKEKWVAWLASIKDEIAVQKKKHLEAQKQLEQEIAELVLEEKKLSNPEEATEDDYMEDENVEDTIDGLLQLQADGPPNGKGPTQDDSTRVEEQEKALQMMQYNMEMAYQQKLEEEKNRMQLLFEQEWKRKVRAATTEVTEISDTEEGIKESGLVPGIGGALMSAKPPIVGATPFGVQRPAKHAVVSSPYGDKEGKKHLKQEAAQKMEEILNMEKKNKQQNQQPPDTGQ